LGSIPDSARMFSAFSILDIERQWRNLSFNVARVFLTDVEGFNLLDFSSFLANSRVCESSWRHLMYSSNCWSLLCKGPSWLSCPAGSREDSVSPDRGAALVLATPMMVSTSIEMNLNFASTSLCSGANKVSSDSSGGGIGHPGY